MVSWKEQENWITKQAGDRPNSSASAVRCCENDPLPESVYPAAEVVSQPVPTPRLFAAQWETGVLGLKPIAIFGILITRIRNTNRLVLSAVFVINLWHMSLEPQAFF